MSMPVADRDFFVHAVGDGAGRGQEEAAVEGQAAAADVDGVPEFWAKVRSDLVYSLQVLQDVGQASPATPVTRAIRPAVTKTSGSIRLWRARNLARSMRRRSRSPASRRNCRRGWWGRGWLRCGAQEKDDDGETEAAGESEPVVILAAPGAVGDQAQADQGDAELQDGEEVEDPGGLEGEEDLVHGKKTMKYE